MCETVAQYFEKKALKDVKSSCLYDAIKNSTVLKNVQPRKKHGNN